VVRAVILGKILPDPKIDDCFIHKHVMRTPQPGCCGCKDIDSPCQACSHPDPTGRTGYSRGVPKDNLWASFPGGRWDVTAAVCPCSWL